MSQHIQTKIKINGLITSEAFQKARLCALKLRRNLTDRFAEPEINGMVQIDWHEYLEKMRRVIISPTNLGD